MKIPTAGSRTVRLPIFENGIKPSASTQQSVAPEGIRAVWREEGGGGGVDRVESINCLAH